MRTKILSAVGVLGVVGLASDICLATVTVTNIGILPGGTYSTATAINMDGSAVAGGADTTADGGGDRAFRWTLIGGIQNLGTLPGGASSGAGGISATGAFVTGTSGYSGGTHAFRWNVATGVMEDIGELPGGSFHSSGGHAISSDGNTIVGNSYSAVGYRAFRWRSVGGIESLGQLPGGFNSNAMAVSGDGSVAAGLSDSTDGNHIFRWTSAGGMQNLGSLNPGVPSYGWGINADGSVVVGKSDYFGSTVAVRWTAATGLQNLGLLPGSPYSSAQGVSGDGSIVVGVSALPGFSGYHAFLWKSSLGMVDLNTYLPTLGADLTGWTLSQALAISADGTAITGSGIYNGQSRAFVVRGLPGGCTAAGISSQPLSKTACPLNGSTFTVTGTGTGPLGYQWKVESPANSGLYVVLSGATFTEPASGLSFSVLGGATNAVAVSNVRLGTHSKVIRVVGVVSNSCGSITSSPATLTVCPADYDCDGFVTGDDFDSYVAAFEAGTINADFDHDGFVTGDDFDSYVEAFEAGC